MSDIGFDGLAFVLVLCLLPALFLLHSLLLLIVGKLKGRFSRNVISLIFTLGIVYLIPEEIFDKSLVATLLIPASLYFLFCFLLSKIETFNSKEEWLRPTPTKEMESRPTPKKNSGYLSILGLIAVIYFFLLEWLSRISSSKSFLEVLLGFREGGKEVVVLVFFLLTALVWILLASDFIRSLHISFTAKPQAYVFLGDKLSKGQFIYKEDDKEKKEVFAPIFALTNAHANSSFHSVYRRAYFVTDSDSHLTPTTDLLPGRIFLLAVMQMGLLAINMGCFYAISSAPTYLIFVGAAALYFVGAFSNWLKMKDFNHGSELIMPLPKSIAPGAVIKGKVVDSEIDTPVGQEKAGDKSFQNYVVRFNHEAGFTIPVYVNWRERRYHANNIAKAVGKLKKERKEAQRLNEKAFVLLDDAMNRGASIEFKLDDDLCIRPVLDEPYITSD
jgi:hypothetical protein